jgi:hypothetical protein
MKVIKKIKKTQINIQKLLNYSARQELNIWLKIDIIL